VGHWGVPQLLPRLTGLGPAAQAMPGPGRARPPRHLADLDPAGRRAAVAELGEPAFRAEQLSRLYFTGAGASVLPADRAAGLRAALLPELLEVERSVSADDGATRKTLYRATGGAALETVLMGYEDRVTVCVSSQAGCGMGCPFCATGQAGLTRNLSAAEIVDQVVRAAHTTAAGELGAGPGRLDHVVFMGMGEPLANYDRMVTAVRALVAPAPRGLGLSQRNLTVSTVGLVPAMRRLAGEGLALTLAVSLHAPDDALRDELVPVNTRWPVAEVLAAAWHYAERTGRRVSIEYALIRDINDAPEQARALAGLLAGRLAHVNLIPLNPTPGSRWDASSPAAQRGFVSVLRAAGVAATVRETRGRDIAGACGQLAGAPAPERARG
jgi:23S rRNA (adenine2503-C2)-methyltransferase